MSDKLKDKIAALLAKAESTDNAFEAETFMSKVNELLEKHQIEMHEVRSRLGQPADPIDMQIGGTNIYASMLWARGVAGMLARYYGCRFVYYKKGNHFQYDIVGTESARTTFELMLPFVISQVRVAAKPLAARVGKSVAERQVGHALEYRIYNLVPAAEERRASNEKNALVPVSDMDSRMEQLYPAIKTAKSKPLNFGSVAHDAASKISINVQTTGNHTKRLA